MKRDPVVIDSATELNSKFVVPLQTSDFGGQYASIYYMRLERLRAEVMKRAEESWGSLKVDNRTMKHIPRVLNVRQGEACWIIGTVYREMKYKPNVLEDVSKSHYGAPTVHHSRYAAPENEGIDVTLLEDESGRIVLTGNVIKSALLVTGCIVAVLGVETEAGHFEVEDIVYAGYAPNRVSQDQSTKLDENQGPRYVVLVSGLNIKSSSGYEPNLLSEFLCGELTTADEELVKQITSVIIAGDSLDGERVPMKDQKPRYLYDPTPFTELPIHQLDKVVNEIAKTMPVHIMPGELDPVSLNMPQQAFHPALFAQSRPLVKNHLIELTSNPYWWDFDGKVRILGTSGQPVTDMAKYFYNTNNLASMDCMLQWRHCAPTAPDTLWSYPFKNDDPFILDETPNVFFAGNQDKFETCIVTSRDGLTSCRLICLPKFSKTGEIVLLELNSLNVELVSLAV